MKSALEAIAFLEKRRVMTLAGAGGAVPSLASEVAGAPVTGSWWGHPKGKEIFRLANELADHPDVLMMKLVLGKVTFVHRALWPAVVRLAIDGERVARATAALSAPARRLLEEIEHEGAVRLDEWARETRRTARALKKAADELESAALVLSRQEHTESGAHATVLQSWDSWATTAVERAVDRLDIERARELLAQACGGLPTVLSAVQSKKPSRRNR